MNNIELLVKKLNIKKISGMDTSNEDDKIFQYIDEFVSSTDNKEWHDFIHSYDREMNKTFISKYGFVPDTLEGMFRIIDIVIDMYDNHRNDINFMSDNLFDYCISKIWRFCMDNNYLDYPRIDDVYENTLKQLRYTEANQQLLDKAWNMIKEKARYAIVSSENLLMISLGMMSFERSYTKYCKKIASNG